MVTKEVFMEALQQYSGTVLIVSHDRYLLDHVVGRILELRDGRLYDYPGNYSWFIDKRALDQQASPAPGPAPKPAAPGPKAGGAAAHQQRKRRQRYAEQLQRRCSEAEGRVDKLERRKAQIEEQLCRREVYEDAAQASRLGSELAEIEEHLPAAYQEWNELCDRVAGAGDDLVT
jgi:ATP-binding cassette subfamily F protein 3